MKNSKFLTFSILMVFLLNACAGTATQTPAPSITPVLPNTGGIDWMDNGFSNVIASQKVAAGAATTIDAGPFTIQIPAGAFTEPVTFNVLTGDLANFKSDAPQGQVPVLAFALNVKNYNGQIVEKFNKPITLTAKDPQIFPDSQYYNVSSDGTFTPNIQGLKVKTGELSHPVAGTSAGWVITTPASEITSQEQATGAPDWVMYGFPNIVASQQITPGTATTIDTGPYSIKIPADAFTEAVTFNLLGGDPASFKANAPSGQIPVLAFAFNVENAEGQFVEKFNKPVTLTVKDPKIFADSQYYNVSTEGTFSANPTGLQVSAGELTHPIASAAVGWVVTSPAAELAKLAATSPDWMSHGFTNVLKTQEFNPGTAMTINASPYTIQVPAKAFTQTVNILVLSGNPTDFKDQLPPEQVPTLAFALNVENSQNQFVVQFNQPITVTIKDSKIVAGSKFFNVAKDGTIVPNPNSLQVQPGELQQSVSTTNNAWMVSAPASPPKSPVPKASPTPAPASSGGSGSTSTPPPASSGSSSSASTPTPNSSSGGG